VVLVVGEKCSGIAAVKLEKIRHMVKRGMRQDGNPENHPPDRVATPCFASFRLTQAACDQASITSTPLPDRSERIFLSAWPSVIRQVKSLA
jgi:hypothetical protein